MILVNAPETPAVKDCHWVVPASAVEEFELFISTDSPVLSVDTLSVPKIVLLPAKDWACVETNPVLPTPAIGMLKVWVEPEETIFGKEKMCWGCC